MLIAPQVYRGIPVILRDIRPMLSSLLRREGAADMMSSMSFFSNAVGSVHKSVQRGLQKILGRGRREGLWPFLLGGSPSEF